MFILYISCITTTIVCIFCSSIILTFKKNMRFFLLLAFFGPLMLLDEAYRFTDETDRHALLVFKSQVSEGKRDVMSSWNNSFPLCKWNGVTCGRKHKRVTGMDLGGFQLGGVISPSIAIFTANGVIPLGFSPSARTVTWTKENIPEDPWSPLGVANNFSHIKSPDTSNAKTMRRPSLTGVRVTGTRNAKTRLHLCVQHQR
ncbi:uncharacterized protein LOC9313434 isoform X2 [Arabidopsis lyrata subsp. lyrata]|uniref:uncharacterized protein LOC9313434 isoform X2 n=1 Tax=Arabidopsis lyrata subsp. lyrata TaxID=81972 RepID=UPI000A29C9DF|nr:uncharacterized protein LOC9313434 isoform X2 [Arabidopsis lyrata subsp. lyrata]|eukprot:XP_020879851.1 uncharacterized protein LOC9313434 isoform X2 [Arabidopsis lyrata subsp. lyrata]